MALRAPLVRTSAWLVVGHPSPGSRRSEPLGSFLAPEIAHWDHDMMIH